MNAPSDRYRPCVALVGGPRNREWYFVEDLQARQVSALRMARGVADIQGWALGYHPTPQTTGNQLGQVAAVWTWQPQRQVTSPTPPADHAFALQTEPMRDLDVDRADQRTAAFTGPLYHAHGKD